MKKHTKIVCTLGPASQSVETVTKMVRAGMNVARLNFSHGTYENHQMLIEHVRGVSKKEGISLAVLQDLQGPKIRVGVLPEKGVTLKEGDRIVFDTGTKKYAKNVIPVDYEELHEHVKPKERILLNDGRSEVVIDKVVGTKIHTTVCVGGVITSHKGINVPDSQLAVRALTDKDKEDAKFGVQQGVDFMALSFVRGADDVLDLRYHIEECEKELGIQPDQKIHIIAKIERREAVENIQEILDVVDGIMVARGDLGIEIPAAEVPLAQKKLIDAALDAAKPVIVATQMLDSMQTNPRPSRAEVSDVANAVIDHADALMLSNESATGKYPVETVETMAEIIKKTEGSAYDTLHMRELTTNQPIDNIVSQLSRPLAEQVGAKLLLSASLSGETARLISRHRPELPMYVATSKERTLRQLALSWGVEGFMLKPCKSIEELIARSIAYLKKKDVIADGDRMVVVAGEPVGLSGHVNLLEVREVE